MSKPASAAADLPDLTRSAVLLRLLPFVATIFLGFLVIGIPLPVLSGQVHDVLGFGATIVGWVIGIQSLATVLTRHYAGTMVDTRGAKRALVAGLAICCLAGGFYWLSASLPLAPGGALALLLGGRVVLGLGESLMLTGGLSWAMNRVGPRHAGKAMAWNGIAMYGALAAGAPIGVWLDQQHGFAALSAAIILLPVLGLAIVLPLAPLPVASAGPRLPFYRVMGKVWRPGAGLAFATVGFGVLAAFLPLHYSARGWDGAGLSLTAFGAAYILARLVLGGLPDRMGGSRVATLSLLVEIVGQLLIWRAGSPEMALAGAAVTGLGFSLIFPSLGVLAVRGVPPQSRGSALGGYVVFFDMALGISGPLAGALATGLGYEAVFLAGAISAGIALVLTLRPAAAKSHASTGSA